MRIQKYLSEVGFCSRREAEEYLRAGKILVNGRKAMLGDKIAGSEEIVIDGRRLQIVRTPKKKVLAFYKPKGVECSLSPAGEGKTLLDFDYGSDRMFPVGHLDQDAHGLLLLTNDGELANRLAHPDSRQDQEYLLVVEGDISPVAIDSLSKGVMLGKKKTAPCRVKQTGDNLLRLVLHDGRTRLIRQMCAAVGLKVCDLLRVRFGEIRLLQQQPGTWRILTETELRKLK